MSAGAKGMEIQKCLVRQLSHFPLQLLSASPSLRQPQLSIAVLMSIGRRRAYLAKGLMTFPRHHHLVHRYARIVGRNAYKMHQPTQPPKEEDRSPRMSGRRSASPTAGLQASDAPPAARQTGVSQPAALEVLIARTKHGRTNTGRRSYTRKRHADERADETVPFSRSLAGRLNGVGGPKHKTALGARIMILAVMKL